MKFHWKFFDSHTRSFPEPMGLRARVVLLMALLLVVGSSFWGVHALMRPDSFFDPQGIDLRGEWDFFNGSPSNKKVSVQKVKVPEPLEPQLREPLAQEFWYVKQFLLTDDLWKDRDKLWIALGSVKGKHQVWLNDKYVGSADGSSLGIYPLTLEQLNKKAIEIRVKVLKGDFRFPGIVHFVPMQIGRGEILQKQISHYYFELGVKPVIPAILRWVLFIGFAAFFLAMPIRREYAIFAFYSLFGAIQALSGWRFFPLYDDFSLRHGIFFHAQILCMAMVPIFVAEFLRFHSRSRFVVWIYSFIFAAIPITAYFMAKSSSQRLSMAEGVHAVWPWLSYGLGSIFCLLAAQYFYRRLHLVNRSVSAAMLGVFLILQAAISGIHSSKQFLYNLFLLPEFLDIAMLGCASYALVGDFGNLNKLFFRAREALPGRVKRLLHRKATDAVEELFGICLVVDTVGYTKKIAAMNEMEKEQFNKKLKSILLPIIQTSGGEKIADTGDGIVALWELDSAADTYSKAHESCFSAARQILAISEQHDDLQFRMGMAQGSMKCFFHSPNFSYLGDPINIASRLESVACAGEVLVHESVSTAPEENLENLRSYLAKGAQFKARVLGKKEKPRLRAA